MPSSTSGDQQPADAPPNQSGPMQPPPTSDPARERVAKTSPEGIPAAPNLGATTVRRTILTLAIIALIVSLAIAVFVNRWVGLALGAFGIGLLLVNPALWSAVLRAKERES